jgi:hypothetical protein
MKLTMTKVGEKNILRRIDRLRDDLLEVGKEIVQKSGARALRRAERTAPVQTGRLRDSIALVSHLWGYELRVGVPYAIWVEFGRYKRPFLFAAYKAERRYMLSRARREKRALISRYARDRG